LAKIPTLSILLHPGKLKAFMRVLLKNQRKDRKKNSKRRGKKGRKCFYKNTSCPRITEELLQWNV